MSEDKRKLWVVEAQYDNGKWEPSYRVAFTRDAARNLAKESIDRSSGLPVRVRCYFPRWSKGRRW